MALYRVEINKKVRKKDLAIIPGKDVEKITTRITDLARNPFPRDAVRLKGREEWRIRQGRYRILYTVNEKTVTVYVVKVAHRKDVYKK